jgi:hypothetical protein
MPPSATTWEEQPRSRRTIWRENNQATALSTTAASRLRTSAAIGISASLPTIESIRSASTAETVVRPSRWWTTALQGSRTPRSVIGLECAVGERWVAGAEDQVRLGVDAELLLQRRLDVDLARDAESLSTQFGAHPLDRLGKRGRRDARQGVAGSKHGRSSF